MPPAVDTPHLASSNHSLTKSRALACAPGWLGRALVRFPGPLFVTFGLTVPICISCSVIIYPQLRRTEFHSASAALEPLQWALAAGAIIFLALTNSVDPGVVTSEMAPKELKIEDVEHEGVTGATRVRGLRRKIHDVEYRWCDTCSVWRPPRASHCDLCQRCFLRFDHLPLGGHLRGSVQPQVLRGIPRLRRRRRSHLLWRPGAGGRGFGRCERPRSRFWVPCASQLLLVLVLLGAQCLWRGRALHAARRRDQQRHRRGEAQADEPSQAACRAERGAVRRDLLPAVRAEDALRSAHLTQRGVCQSGLFSCL